VCHLGLRGRAAARARHHLAARRGDDARLRHRRRRRPAAADRSPAGRRTGHRDRVGRDRAGVTRAAARRARGHALRSALHIDRVVYPTLPPVPTSRLVSTPHGTCTHVAPGHRATLPFAIAVESEGDGRVKGTLALTLTGVGGKKIESAVPFTLAIARPVSTT